MSHNFANQKSGLQDVVSQLEQTVVCISRIVTWLQQQDNKIFETFECEQDFRIAEIQNNALSFQESLPTEAFSERFSGISKLTAQIQEIEKLANKSLDLTLQEHFQQRSKCHTNLETYFAGIRSKVQIEIDEYAHLINLSFGDRPKGKNFNPIKILLCHEICTRLMPFSKTEFTIGFGQLCDLKEVAWSVAVAYQNLGYQVQILCGTEVIDAETLMGENPLPQSWQNPSPRVPVQKELADFVREMWLSRDPGGDST